MQSCRSVRIQKSVLNEDCDIDNGSTTETLLEAKPLEGYERTYPIPNVYMAWYYTILYAQYPGTPSIRVAATLSNANYDLPRITEYMQSHAVDLIRK